MHETLAGRIFVTQGDITRLAADAVTFSSSSRPSGSGKLEPSFRRHYPEFLHRLACVHRCELGDRELALGEALWVPLGDGKPCGVVVVASVAGAGQEGSQSAGQAVAGAIRKAFDALRDREAAAGIPGGRLLLAMPYFRAGAGADERKLFAVARAEMCAARRALDELQVDSRWRFGMDVVFVAYTRAHYRLLLQARRAEGVGPARIPEPLAGLANELSAGECVLFVGSGLSRTAGLTSYEDLIRRMAADLGQTPPPGDLYGYMELAQWYREERPKKLQQLIVQTFAAGAASTLPSLDHYLLLSLPITYVLTTNYDSLIEQTLDALRRSPVLVASAGDIAATGQRQGVFVVKLHGDAASSAGDIIITRDDLESFTSKRRALTALLEGLMLNQTFFFIGYSLRDPNFRSVYLKISDILNGARRAAYAVAFDRVRPGERSYWSNQKLELIEFGATQPEERAWRVTELLDGLADEVNGRASVFLSPSLSRPAEAGKMHHLAQALVRAGRDLVEAIELIKEGRKADELEDTLHFLVQHGWRPQDQKSVASLWERLAEASARKEVRRRRLSAALQEAEDMETAERLRAQIAAIEPPRREDPHSAGTRRQGETA